MAKSKVTIKPLKLDTQNLQKEILEQVGFKIVEHAVATAPTDTGYYKSHIEYDGSNSVIAHAQYSAHLEYGTADHGPVKAKALKWVNKNKEVVFAKRVRGIKPYATMRNAAAQTQKEVVQIVREVLKQHGL